MRISQAQPIALASPETRWRQRAMRLGWLLAGLILAHTGLLFAVRNPTDVLAQLSWFAYLIATTGVVAMFGLSARQDWGTRLGWAWLWMALSHVCFVIRVTGLYLYQFHRPWLASSPGLELIIGTPSLNGLSIIAYTLLIFGLVCFITQQSTVRGNAFRLALDSLYFGVLGYAFTLALAFQFIPSIATEQPHLVIFPAISMAMVFCDALLIARYRLNAHPFIVYGLAALACHLLSVSLVSVVRVSSLAAWDFATMPLFALAQLLLAFGASASSAPLNERFAGPSLRSTLVGWGFWRVFPDWLELFVILALILLQQTTPVLVALIAVFGIARRFVAQRDEWRVQVELHETRDQAQEKLRLVRYFEHELKGSFASMNSLTTIIRRRLTQSGVHAGEMQRIDALIELTSATRQTLDHMLILHRRETHVLERERVCLASIWQEIVNESASATVHGAHAFTFSACATLPAIEADSVWLKLALYTIVRNALESVAKTMPSPPFVRCTVTVPEAGWVAIEIRDLGSGFEPGLLAQLRAKLASGEDVASLRASTTAGGYGLGLSLVQYVATLHQGRLTVGNAEAGGAWVTLTLPVTAPATSDVRSTTVGSAH